ncbi:MAG TPA: lysophospholipid acyltransferase family protein [Actinomycetota bacterium]|nr:lysophospholipid acyltransferase family protein [Actinomycetota bacterium]
MSTTGSYRVYRAAALVVKPSMHVWFRMRIEGAAQVPATGPVILACNHRSNVDPVLLASAIRRPVTFMAKAELFVGPLRWILNAIEQFPVRRGGIDREALRDCAAVLGRGGVLGLFPEGTRGDGRFTTIHPGVAYVVVQQNCPIVPVAIFGTERVRRRFGWLPWAAPVRIVFGAPFQLPDPEADPGPGDGGARAARRAATDQLGRLLREFLERVERQRRRRDGHDADTDILTNQ